MVADSCIIFRAASLLLGINVSQLSSEGMSYNFVGRVFDICPSQPRTIGFFEV